MNQLTSKLLAQKIGNEKKAIKVQQKEEDIDMIENPLSEGHYKYKYQR